MPRRALPRAENSHAQAACTPRPDDGRGARCGRSSCPIRLPPRTHGPVPEPATDSRSLPNAPRQHASWRRCANRTEPSRYSPAPSRVSLRAGQVPIIETSLQHVLPEMRTASSDTAWAEMDTRLAIRQAAIGKPLVGARPHLLRGLRRSGPHAIPGPHAVRTGFILRGRRASLGIWHPK